MTDKDNIPRHVAIIMDGNGRWAKKHNLPRTAGHRQGVKVVEKIIEAASESGVKVLSLYAFSTENWSRPEAEVNLLLRMLHNFLKSKIAKLIKNNIKLRVMGEIDKFAPNIKKLLIEAQEKTKENSGLILNIALNYGSRFEIVKATKKIVKKIIEGGLNIESLDEDNFGEFLYTSNLPDPDLLIRTSGEMRLSNFMLWQLSYTELYFSDKFWPDFSSADFKHAIGQYQKRERRFGDIYAHT